MLCDTDARALFSSEPCCLPCLTSILSVAEMRGHEDIPLLAHTHAQEPRVQTLNDLPRAQRGPRGQIKVISAEGKDGRVMESKREGEKTGGWRKQM